jgi:hypothetical protein
MKITLKQAADSLNALRILCDRELPMQVAYQLSKVSGEIAATVSEFEKAQNKRARELDLAMPLSEKASEHERFERIKNIEKFNEEKEILMETTKLAINCKKISRADLGSAPIKPLALVGVGFLLED